MDFNNSDSSDEENDLDDYVGKNGVMFLIDFRQNMFQFNASGQKTHFRSCLNIYKNLLIDIAKTGKNDLVGLSLIGTERGTSDVSPLLANIQPLSEVSAARIKEIDSIIIDEGESLKNKYGRISSSTLNLVKVLNSSMKLFLNYKKKIYLRTLVILTSDDDPFGADNRSAHLARKQARKLSGAAIDLVVVGIGESFDPNKFYNELISLARGEFNKDWSKINRVKKLDDIDNHLLSVMSRLSRTHRSLHFGHNLSIPVSLYKLFKEPKIKFKTKKVERREEEDNSDNDNGNSQTSGSKMNTVNKDDMVPLIGGKLINLTRSEFKKANFNVEVGITIIGFVSSQDVPEYLTIKPPRIMLPNYFSEDGTAFFNEMLEHCLNERLSILAWYKYIENGLLSLVCCHPKPEHTDSKGNICPAGFCMVTLPFSDNYSDPDFEKFDIESSEKQIEAAKHIIKKLSAGFSFDTFHDYELQRTYAMMEALALDYDEVPTVNDDTILDDSNVDERIADFIDDFMDCTHLGEYDTIATAPKRPAETSYRATKNPKLSSLDGIVDLIREGKGQMLTVTQLKQALDAKGIHYSASFKKPQLVELAARNIK